MKTQNEPDQAGGNARLDQLLRENERLRGDLLTVSRRISHDLRTPLGVIINTGEILKEVLAEKGISDSPLVTQIIDSAEEMTQFIGQVSFALRASVNPIGVERVNMGDVVFRVLQHWEGKLLRHSIAVSEPAKWPEVHAVFHWLEVIWENFLANAIQSGADKIELGWRQEKMNLRFWICDNGRTIPSETSERLFQPFEALHESGAASDLGLPIIRRLVELQGGGYGYTPQSGGGSCFYFTLPMKAE